MNLYEITTGRVGESYERCYAWAVSEEFALAQFELRHPSLKLARPVSVKFLFAHTSPGFCTKLSDAGWDDEPN